MEMTELFQLMNTIETVLNICTVLLVIATPFLFIFCCILIAFYYICAK